MTKTTSIYIDMPEVKDRLNIISLRVYSDGLIQETKERIMLGILKNESTTALQELLNTYQSIQPRVVIPGSTEPLAFRYHYPRLSRLAHEVQGMLSKPLSISLEFHDNVGNHYRNVRKYLDDQGVVYRLLPNENERLSEF